jgi:sulfide:quinone oxidoreductase
MRRDPKSVLIAGGGVGGLEALLALQALASESVRVRMLAPDRHFVYRPLSTGEPFGHGRTVQVELARVAEDLGVELLRDAVERIEPDAKRILGRDGAEVGTTRSCCPSALVRRSRYREP